MRCKEYIFKLSSGQLAEAGVGVRLVARSHYLLCKRCRAFTRNHQKLDGILATYRQQLQQPDGQE